MFLPSINYSINEDELVASLISELDEENKDAQYALEIDSQLEEATIRHYVTV